MLQGIDRNGSHFSKARVDFPGIQSHRYGAGINHCGCIYRITVSVISVAVHSGGRHSLSVLGNGVLCRKGRTHQYE